MRRRSPAKCEEIHLPTVRTAAERLADLRAGSSGLIDGHLAEGERSATVLNAAESGERRNRVPRGVACVKANWYGPFQATDVAMAPLEMMTVQFGQTSENRSDLMTDPVLHEPTQVSDMSETFLEFHEDYEVSMSTFIIPSA
jgi:hypothetical protein